MGVWERSEPKPMHFLSRWPLVPPAPVPVDYAGLAETLSVLSYGARLELVQMLTSPQPLGEIRLAPHRGGVENPDRAMSKQAVQAHLEKLLETGLVHTETRDVEGRSLKCYVSNAQRLYSLVEDLRHLVARHTEHIPAGDETGTMASPAARKAAQGPRLVLVHGVYEGRAYPLEGDGAWLIGRRKDNPIALDYDPFVSSEHARVRREGNGFVVEDVPASKNGTLLNWTLLPKGGSARLRPGDVVGVGRSLLVMAGDPEPGSRKG